MPHEVNLLRIDLVLLHGTVHAIERIAFTVFVLVLQTNLVELECATFGTEAYRPGGDKRLWDILAEAVDVVFIHALLQVDRIVVDRKLQVVVVGPELYLGLSLAPRGGPGLRAVG